MEKSRYEYSFWSAGDGWYRFVLYKNGEKIAETDIHGTTLEHTIDFYLRWAKKEEEREWRELLEEIEEILELDL